MKRKSILFLTAVFLMTLRSIAQDTYTIVEGGARLRAEPNTTSTVLAQLPAQTALTILETVDGGAVNGSTTWFKVSVNGQTGFIHSSLLSQGVDAKEDETLVDLEFPGKLLFVYFGQESSLYLADGEGKNVHLLEQNAFNSAIVEDNAPSWSPDSTKLAFASDKEGDAEIYVIDLESDELQQLTHNTGFDSSPSWSPDGNQILFVSNQNPDRYKAQYVMNSDGSEQRQLQFEYIFGENAIWGLDGSYILVQGIAAQSRDKLFRATLDNPSLEIIIEEHAGLAGKAALSPDGRYIAYSAANQSPGFAQLYVANSDGSDSHLLMEESNGADYSPSWSPNGEQIIYTNQTGRDDARIYIVNIDGTGKRAFVRSGQNSDQYAVWSPDGQRVAFLGTNQVYRMYVLSSPDSSPQELAESGWAYAWSPDGQQLAYISFGDSNIYTLSLNDPRPKRLTRSGGMNSAPAWSPDGSQIAYAKPNGDNMDIYVVSSDGDDPAKISTVNRAQSLSDLAWSPDGNYLGLVAQQLGHLYTINVSTSEVQQVDGGVRVGQTFDWSADSQHIVFTQNGAITEQIATVDIQTENVTILTSNDSYHYGRDPLWSPDGQQIVYTYQPNSNPDIYVMNADGSNKQALTDNSAQDQYPLWSSDGEYIAFISERDGNAEVYVMRANGSNELRLTASSGQEVLRGWIP